MVRTLILSAAACVLTLSATSVASAQYPRPLPRPFPQPTPFPQRFPRPVPLPPPVEHHYHVMYRTCSHGPWRCFGTYDCDRQAHRVEELLERRGYQARVEHH